MKSSKYTVGWICAIKTEYVAAQAFLDEEHDTSSRRSHHDPNDYTLGRMGKHNVIIAVLPNGEYGKSSAAAVMSHMLHSFPNIQVVLMVGIGGGVPSARHDIRLGDVVVSSPSRGNSGVFQYDFGKSVQDQRFHHTGFMNQPPTVLRTAVAGLEASYERKGHRLRNSIGTALIHNPRLGRKYSKPSWSSDRLYVSEYSHRGKLACADGCSSDYLIPRRPRSEQEDNPAIHCGLIASGDTLMKDAIIRDTLAEEHDVLCFEMEAAGLMNNFPCLVIRGICDYSDSHKNKEWQGYAAMTAAAYTKDLLKRVSPMMSDSEQPPDEDSHSKSHQSQRVLIADFAYGEQESHPSEYLNTDGPYQDTEETSTAWIPDDRYQELRWGAPRINHWSHQDEDNQSTEIGEQYYYQQGNLIEDSPRGGLRS
ncbi:unnamed protein product [Clonostachys solani]|uniref:Nucleoside phosphorylase domain-containing protein n=1 Tax=Clonostachys solani TaxID=160281 RepID=A0A9N9W1C7_9HYPO|nr:unnamed protein product [Clonostachys solani]